MRSATEFFPQGRQIENAAIRTLSGPDGPPGFVDRGDVPRLRPIHRSGCGSRSRVPAIYEGVSVMTLTSFEDLKTAVLALTEDDK